MAELTKAWLRGRTVEAYCHKAPRGQGYGYSELVSLDSVSPWEGEEHPPTVMVTVQQVTLYERGFKGAEAVLLDGTVLHADPTSDWPHGLVRYM